MKNKYSQNLKVHMIIQIIFFIVLIVIDRITKYAAVARLKGKDAFVIIKDVLEFRYLENSGAAFGIFQNMQWMFYIITVIILAVIVFLFIRLYRKLSGYTELADVSSDGSESRFKPQTYRSAIFLGYMLSSLAAGAVGNMIDRIVNKYVVDFIYFRIINFPIFNFADICVTVTAILLIIFFIFIYKEDPDLSLFTDKKKD